MNYDWNSFYGTFAQSAGAIIGILAAFLISKLLGVNDQFQILCDEFENNRIKYSDLKRALSNRYFTWYNQQSIENSTLIQKKLYQGVFNGMTDGQVLNELYSQLKLFKDDNTIISAFRELEKDQYPKRVFPFLPIFNMSLLSELDKEREKITELERSAFLLIDLFKQNKFALLLFRNHLKPLVILTAVLLISFPIMVVYPLHFLPIPANEKPQIIWSFAAVTAFLVSVKGILLSSFFLIFQSTLVYFLKIILNVRKNLSAVLVKHSSEYCDIASYSSYLAASDVSGHPPH